MNCVSGTGVVSTVGTINAVPTIPGTSVDLEHIEACRINTKTLLTIENIGHFGVTLRKVLLFSVDQCKQDSTRSPLICMPGFMSHSLIRRVPISARDVHRPDCCTSAAEKRDVHFCRRTVIHKHESDWLINSTYCHTKCPRPTVAACTERCQHCLVGDLPIHYVSPVRTNQGLNDMRCADHRFRHPYARTEGLHKPCGSIDYVGSQVTART